MQNGVSLVQRRLISGCQLYRVIEVVDDGVTARTEGGGYTECYIYTVSGGQSDGKDQTEQIHRMLIYLYTVG